MGAGSVFVGVTAGLGPLVQDDIALQGGRGLAGIPDADLADHGVGDQQAAVAEQDPPVWGFCPVISGEDAARRVDGDQLVGFDREGHGPGEFGQPLA